LRRLLRPSGEGTLERLVVCGACGQHLVNPVAWNEADESSWWVQLRCGACEWTREGVFDDDQVKRLERDLALGVRAIENAAAELDRERMEREADTFSAALERDLIGPADFARGLPR
jgi:hypothetical protein